MLPPRPPPANNRHVLACRVEAWRRRVLVLEKPLLTDPGFYKHFEPWRGRLAEGLDADRHKEGMAIIASTLQRFNPSTIFNDLLIHSARSTNLPLPFGR